MSKFTKCALSWLWIEVREESEEELVVEGEEAEAQAAKEEEEKEKEKEKEKEEEDRIYSQQMQQTRWTLGATAQLSEISCWLAASYMTTAAEAHMAAAKKVLRYTMPT